MKPADSPHEYVEELKAQNKALRRGLLETCAELERTRRELDRVLLNKYAQQTYVARPGISDVD